MLDLLIRSGMIVDGTGSPARRADIGIRDGKIAELGRIQGSARTVLDVDGLTVTPGFIDPHVHYDGQIMWDPACTPSCHYGVTTVIGGNCGFGIAPLGPANADYILELLANVEGIPTEALRKGSDWGWTGFSEWLDRLAPRIAVNAAFLAGHSTIRRFVLGDAATVRPATEDEIRSMCSLLEELLAAGALGLSTSRNENHLDGQGHGVPSRSADEGELIRLAQVLRSRPGSVLEIVPAMDHAFEEADYDFLTRLGLASKGTILWNSLSVDAARPEWHEKLLGAAPHAAARGARVVALSIPDVSRLRLSFSNGMILQALPGWAPLFALSRPERIEALRDPAWRARLRAGLASATEGGLYARYSNFASMRIGEARSPEFRSSNGRRLGEVATERGIDPLDLAFDLAVAERLEAGFWAPALGDDESSWRLRSEVWQRDDVLVGGGDAGAHLDAIDSFNYFGVLAGPVVRDRRLLSFESAVQLLTSRPAALFGLTDRGVIRVGAAADLVVLDPGRFGPGELQLRDDLPGGGTRLYSEAVGLHHVFVNGVHVVREGRLTGSHGGRVLGRDRASA